MVVLGNGELTKALRVSAHRFTRAREKIEKAGGTVTKSARKQSLFELGEQNGKSHSQAISLWKNFSPPFATCSMCRILHASDLFTLGLLAVYRLGAHIVLRESAGSP